MLPGEVRLSTLRWVYLVLAMGCGSDTSDSGLDPTNGGPDGGDGSCVPDGSGYLDATLSGDLSAELDWADAVLSCGGAAFGGEATLTFESDYEGGRLAFALAIEGFDGSAPVTGATSSIDLTGSAVAKAGAYTGSECLTNITSVNTLESENGLTLVAVEGSTTCTAPATALLGGGTVNIDGFAFRGVLGSAR